MILTLRSRLRQGRHTLRKWLLDPKIHLFARGSAWFLAGFFLSAASLGNLPMPLAMGLICGSSSWSALLAALGAGGGYLIFWGSAGQQGLAWVGCALLASLIPGRQLRGPGRFLLPALGALIVSAAGVVFQLWLGDGTSVPLYLLRVALGGASAALFTRVLQERDPLSDWLAAGVAVLALAQVAPLPVLSLGFPAAAALTVRGAFPAAALAGIALDLSGTAPLPMTAVLSAAWLLRFWDKAPRWLRAAAPAAVYLLFLSLYPQLSAVPLPGLLAGGAVGVLLPGMGTVPHRRGETGIAQVRLELAASVLSQTEQILLEVTPTPPDETALVARAAERACGSCPCRKSCRDARGLARLSGELLHKPLLTPEELPVQCRKSGRFLSELHRSQEQLRAIRADRQRQREYREAVVQQYRFLSDYLRDLSDSLSRRTEGSEPVYRPEVRIFGSRPETDNGDRCLSFAGTGCRYYVLLCDGMGTGLGAVAEARTAGTILRRLLAAGFPAEYALGSINSLCALRERAGAVTVDLAELSLDTGRISLYKWGAAPSYLVSAQGVRRLGVPGAPPGLSVSQCRETRDVVTLRRGEQLLLLSDGIPESLAGQALRPGQSPEELGRALLKGAELEDDATAVCLRLIKQS